MTRPLFDFGRLEPRKACRLPRTSIALALFFLGATAWQALAQVPTPDARTSTIPSRIVLVGPAQSGPDVALGRFEIVVRDRYSNPMAFVLVYCQLLPDTDFRLASNSLDPQVGVDCANRIYHGLSGVDGVASFTILGGGRSAVAVPGGVLPLIARARANAPVAPRLSGR